jgi:hypothetical protein
MMINWDEIHKELIPVKSYEDLSHRFQVAFIYPLISTTYNFTIPELIAYTRRLLAGDSRGRYNEYTRQLVRVFTALQVADVVDVKDLHERTSTRSQLELFVTKSGISASDIILVLKYLIYWFIPGEKYLSGLVRDDAQISAAINVLRELGIRTNLEILQTGSNAEGRNALAARSGLPPAIISELVNRADFSRMPWASKATISNIIGAGYESISRLARANPEQLYADFFRYGESIGKNLKLGNEIENSFRIAKIVPVLLQEE